MVATNIVSNSNFFYRTFFKLFGKNSREGAETSIYLASSPEVEKITGEYFSDKKISRSSPESYNMETARKLWKLSEDYVHLRLGIVLKSI